MIKRNAVLAGVFAAVALAVMGGAGLWYYLRSDAPEAVSLEAALQSVSATSTSATGVDAELEGTWSIVQGSNSFVGYRVDETLGGIGATTAVGRTQSVEGSLVYDGDAITQVQIAADVSTLQSDKSIRDDQLKRQALETSTYPTATFVLSNAINMSQVPAEGVKVIETVTGSLTLHGVTKQVQLEVQGVIQNGQLVLVGSTDIRFADFNIAQPVSAAVLSIEDHGTMEFQLVFARAA